MIKQFTSSVAKVIKTSGLRKQEDFFYSIVDRSE